MNRKIIAIAFVLMMVAASSVVVVQTDSSDAEETKTCTTTFVPDIYWWRNDTASFTYHTGDHVYDTYYADLTELEKKDAEFEAYWKGGAEYVNSVLKDGHSYSSYHYSTGRVTFPDKIIFIKGEKDPVYLNSGTYNLKITNASIDSSVCLARATSDGNYTIVSYSLRVGEEYTLINTGFNAFWFMDDSTSVCEVQFEITGGSSDKELGDTPVTKTSINNIYAWYKADVNLSGHYSMDSDQLMFIKGSNDEKRFVSEIVDKNVYYSLSDDIMNKYNSLRSGNYSGTFTVYTLCKAVDLRVNDSISKLDDSGNYSSVSMTLVRQTEDKVHLFSTAYSTIKLAIGDYDVDRYTVYLIFSSSMVPLKPNTVYTIENTSAKTYSLVVSNNIDDVTSLYTDIAISTEGVPDVESNPMIFAAVCIGICVLVFGIVFISGKKPKWAKKKYDKKLAKKYEAAKKQEQALAEEARQQEPVPPVEDDVPKDAPQTEQPPADSEEAPKKRRFGRSKKE